MLLFGVYEVLDQLGSGGMGDVYRARHRQLGGLRAIKVIHPAFAGRPEAVEFSIAKRGPCSRCTTTPWCAATIC